MGFKFWLIVQVMTGDGFTQFDMEYPNLRSCQLAMVHTAAAQALKEGSRNVRLECREWSLPKRRTKKVYGA